MDVLSKSDISEKMIIADLNRKLTVLKVSERRLKKQYSLILEDNLHLNEQINNLQSEILAIQGATLHRVNYLEHFKVSILMYFNKVVDLSFSITSHNISSKF